MIKIQYMLATFKFNSACECCEHLQQSHALCCDDQVLLIWTDNLEEELERVQMVNRQRVEVYLVFDILKIDLDESFSTRKNFYYKKYIDENLRAEFKKCGINPLTKEEIEYLLTMSKRAYQKRLRDCDY